MHKHTAVKA